MPKIKVELELLNDKYCETIDKICPLCFEEYRCALFDVELENDNKNHYYCIRCDKCKQAEVKDDK